MTDGLKLRFFRVAGRRAGGAAGQSGRLLHLARQRPGAGPGTGGVNTGGDNPWDFDCDWEYCWPWEDFSYGQNWGDGHRLDHDLDQSGRGDSRRGNGDGQPPGIGTLIRELGRVRERVR